MTTVEPPHACPVCDERHETAVPVCFRCQTTLTAWWNLESALTAAPERESVPVAVHGPSRRFQWLPGLAATGVAGLLLGLMLARVPPAAAPDPSVATMPSRTVPETVVPSVIPPADPPTPSRFVVYHVQRGDTLWRISAAITGDGRNWTQLWPERVTRPATLRPGTTLRVAVDD